MLKQGHYWPICMQLKCISRAAGSPNGEHTASPPHTPLVETTAAQPHNSLCGGKSPDVTVIGEIKSFDLIPITITEMSPE